MRVGGAPSRQQEAPLGQPPFPGVRRNGEHTEEDVRPVVRQPRNAGELAAPVGRQLRVQWRRLRHWMLIGSALLRLRAQVVMLGLDAAGKTTILYKLHIGEVLSTVPTIGTVLLAQAPPGHRRPPLGPSPGFDPWRSHFWSCFSRVQRGEGAVQERRVHGLGRGRPGEAAAALEALLQQHGRADLRGGLPGQGQDREGSHGVQGATSRAAGDRPLVMDVRGAPRWTDAGVNFWELEVVVVVLRVCVCVQNIIDDPLMRNSAILVYANKQDMVSAWNCVSSSCAAALHFLTSNLRGPNQPELGWHLSERRAQA